MRRRVIATPWGAWGDPAEAFSTLCRGDSPAFWLDSGTSAVTGWSYLGVASRAVTACVADDTVTQWPSGDTWPGTIFDFVRGEQAPGIDTEAGHDVVGPFQLGWVGWLGYELHAQTVGTTPGHSSRYPDAALLFADSALAFNHAAGTVTHLTLEGDAPESRPLSGGPSEFSRLSSGASEFRRLSGGPSEFRRLSSGPGTGPRIEATPARHRAVWAHTDDDYRAMIGDCQRRIAAGDAYQLCLTTQVHVDTHPDPVDTYLSLRELSPSHHGGFVRIDGVSLLSSSPERFLSVGVAESRGDPRFVESKPIKGTRRRGTTLPEDDELKAQLLASDKERAENLMIVDLMRNDIGRVSELGTVTVSSLLEVETYAQVHQLVSTVRGVLASDKAPMDAVVACFPAGSMTGAPKHAAIRALNELERRARGVYSGAFGYFGLDGRIDLAMVIRSIILDQGGATVGTGGGITALSVPQEEVEEVRVKVAALLRVLGAAERMRA